MRTRTVQTLGGREKECLCTCQGCGDEVWISEFDQWPGELCPGCTKELTKKPGLSRGTLKGLMKSRY